MLGGNVFGWTADEKTSFDLLDRFVGAGLNAVDTADAYSRWVPGNKGGESETIIGKWMKSRKNRDRVVVITKVGSEMGPGMKGLSAAYIERAGREYAQLSATPTEYVAFQEQIGKMWEGEPNWTDAQLRKIRIPVWVVDGEHDEGIKRDHTEYMAATIPGARLLILSNVSHFAFLQDPVAFNKAILSFLGGRQQGASRTPRAHR